MRPLKPYLLALSGLIAAVFGGLFLGAPVKVPLLAPTAPQPELEPRSAAPAREIVASRGDARLPFGKVPAPQPHFPGPDLWHAETPAPAPQFCATNPSVVRARLEDRRTRLLVGVVELRL